MHKLESGNYNALKRFTIMNKLSQIILLATIISFAYDFTYAQSENKFAVGLSGEIIGGGSWGEIVCVAGEVDYHLSKIFSIGGLYRGGSQGLYGFGAAEPRPEWGYYASSYHEVSSLFIYNYDDTIARLYIGAGVGMLWGDKVNGNNYSSIGMPFVMGVQFYTGKDFRIGLKYTGNINQYTTFKGLGLDLGLNL